MNDIILNKLTKEQLIKLVVGYRESSELLCTYCPARKTDACGEFGCSGAYERGWLGMSLESEVEDNETS